MKSKTFALIAASMVFPVYVSAAPQTSVQRGHYLVNLGGCNDCHSPKTFGPQGPQLIQGKLLSGHPADQKLPDLPAGVIGPNAWGAVTTNDLTAWVGPWGTTFAANLTPDDSGIGKWSADDFVKAMRTGKHLGVGRPILPPMPYQAVQQLNDDDLKAVFAYIHSLKPIKNQVPDAVIAAH